MPYPEEVDVVVVGAGNAALCAALSARERALTCWCSNALSEADRGGNSRYTAGAIRTVYDGLDDLLKLVPDLNEEEMRNTDFGTYTEDQFYADMDRIPSSVRTRNSSDHGYPELAYLAVVA